MSTIARPATIPRATLADPMKTKGKAELAAGKIGHDLSTDHRPNRIATRISRPLDHHAEATGKGFAFTATMVYAVPKLSTGRESFSPDASDFPGPAPRTRWPS